MTDGIEYTDFVELDDEARRDEVVCSYRFQHADDVDAEWAAGAIAAESSIGTWEPGLKTMNPGVREKAARVVELSGRAAEIAYPAVLFEAQNIPQVLSSIAGNVYGLSELRRLRLDDVELPSDVVRSHAGPALGVEEVRRRVGAVDRPVVGTIVKPKLGLTAEQHAEVARDSWLGGLDVVKDDENLASMEFNDYYERVERTLEAKQEAEDETGEHKLYFPNVTAPCDEMLRRAEAAVDAGGDYVMVDVLTAGWSAVQTLRDHLPDDVGVHGHRAMHAAFTRLPDHGVSMLAVAKFARLAGVDNLHAGAVVGKMEGGREEVEEIYGFLRGDWHGLKTTIPVASGGLHPGLVGSVVDILGVETVVQAGGGVHGHPDGTRAGARAMREAAEAVAAGETAEERARTSEELAAAIDRWGVEPR
ncbi:MAG: ribulose-bisphosphate carboxylase large subunit [Halobacteriales archaeon]